MLGFVLGLWTYARSNTWVWKAAAAIGVTLALLGLVMGLIGHGRSLQRREDAAALETARVEAATKQAAALAKSEEQRLKDEEAVAAMEKDLTSAYAKTPDGKPSAVRLALACRRLRQQSGPGAKLPPACGPQA